MLILLSWLVIMLAALEPTVTVDIDGFGPVLFCHATPRADDEVVLVDSRRERWAEVFAGLPQLVRAVVCGHTHMPFVRLVDRCLVANPGSIGMPYGRPGGNWALLQDGAVSLHRTIIDIEAAIARVVAESDYPDRREWADYFIRAAASDAESLTAFATEDGRPV
ncbi:metallophosphoesterase family protein [Arthrobacter terrae]|uniref:metallophosphoesterase family protein n=1 Tax=Arthrobacter terrae TaxID=2935737 RepID=UPI0028ACD276|nr:metallophosphoesterase family protein [Arthrobacter terrae]